MRNLIIGCLLALVLVLLAVVILIACRARTDTESQVPVPQPAGGSVGPGIKIAWPQNGARVRIGQSFQVHALAMDPRGIFSIAVMADGQAITPVVAAPPLTTFSAVLPVTFQTKGVHTIAVQANSTTGAKSEVATIKIVAVQNLSDPPAAGDPAMPVPEVPSGPPPAPPIDQPPPPPVPPGASVNFVASPTRIQSGQCSTLRWDVDGVREIYFEGVGVTGHEQRQQCPTQTTTYTLRVVFLDGSVRDYTATVALTGNDGQSFAITNVKVRLDPGNYSGGCPGTVRFVGEITSNGTGSVHVVWVRGGNPSEVSPATDLTFTRAETKTVTWNSQVTVTAQHPVRLDVFNSDNSVAGRSEAVNLTVNCSRTSFAVTQATVSVNLSTYNGPCPKTFTAGAKITANGAGTVKYRWERKDGMTSETRIVEFDAAGEKSVTNFDWQMSSSGNHWMQLHVLEPNDLVSNRGETTWNCTNASAFQVTHVTADVNPEIFSGMCPKSINYSGTITTNGPGTVTYKWVRSDGEGEARTINFTAAGSQTVTSGNVTYDQAGTHWAKLQVTAPNVLISDQAKFTLNCASPAIVTLVSVNINPTAFTGACPHTFHFNGTIRVNAPGTITYRWERSDGNSDTRTLQFSAAGDQTIPSGDFKSGSSGTFWARLHVLTPNDKVSNQASFVLTCN